MWDFLDEQAAPFMAAAARRYGRAVLGADGGDAGPDDRDSVGRRLLQLVFGTNREQEFPQLVADLVGDPDDQEALAEVTARADDVFQSDPGKAEESASVIAGFYRAEVNAGQVGALVDLGELLYWDDPEAAQAAYAEAVDAGHMHALLDLAKILIRVNGNEGAALAAYRKAISCGDPDVATEAMYEVALVHIRHRDADAARGLLEQVIGTGHPEWAAAAMVGLAGLEGDDPATVEALYRRAIEAGTGYWSGHATTALALLLEGRGDVAGATAVLRQLVNSGSTEFASTAAFDLAELLERTGDVAGAKTAWQQLTDAADQQLAGSAFLNLVNLLRDQEDGDGLRAAYQAAASVSNPEALYALDQLGQLLHDRGDVEGAHTVWQEAIDAGCEHAEDLREQMMPESEKRRQREAYPPDLPPELNPANILHTGIEVLEHGLPALPETLTYQMAIPVAYWKTEQCAVVLVLRYTSPWRSAPEPAQMMVVYSRASDGSWTPPGRVGGISFAYDPIARPDGGMRALGGRQMVTGGGSHANQATPGRPAAIVTGLAGPEIKYLAVLQDGSEDRRPLESHFGAWVVCTEQRGELEVAGLDEDGNVVDSIRDVVGPDDW